MLSLSEDAFCQFPPQKLLTTSYWPELYPIASPIGNEIWEIKYY